MCLIDSLIPKAAGLAGLACLLNLLLQKAEGLPDFGEILAGVNDVLRACGHPESADINMLQLLLYGNNNLPFEANKMILNLTIKYISETERFG